MRRCQNAADLSGRFAIRMPQKVRMFQELLGMERLRNAKPVLLAIAAVCGLLVTVGGGAETPSAARQATIAASPAHAHQSGKSSGLVQSSLDFETYRTRIEPIFLKQRQGGVRCYDCHSVLATRLRLEPLSPGNSAWTTEQSRRNFEVISQLITPSDPLKSRLLLHPLAQEAGGDSSHTGGKFWASQSDPEWKILADWVRHSTETRPATHTASRSNATDALDFQFFRTKVEPIFLKERPGHARCYGCHVLTNRTFHLETLSPGGAAWTDEQSQRNFQSALQQVVPGKPASSRLLIHPLAPEAGGDPFHSGGRQFASQNDPDWLVLAEWVRSLSEPSSAATAWIFVTNSAGDTIDVIDATTNNVVQVIRGIELPHGIAFSPDGTRVYVSNESESVLDVVDRKSGKVERKISLSARPNNLAITKDGGRVLVGIRTDAGVIDVIDTTSLTRVKRIPVDGSVHNVFVTPDGKSLWVNSTVANAVFKYSLPELKLLGYATLPEVHPLERSPTGSVPEWITFTPDSKVVYVSNSGAGSVSAIDANTLQEIAVIPVGEVPKRINTLLLH